MSRMSPHERTKGREKIEKVMHEFAEHALKSSSGQPVTDKDQALAIGYSEQRRKERKRRK